MDHKSYVYPNAKQSIGATFIVLLISLLAAAALSFLHGSYTTFIQYTVPMILAFLYLQHYQNTHSDPIPVFKWTLGNLSIYPLIIVCTLSILTVNSFLGSFIPMPEFVIEIFEKVIGDNGIFTFLTVAISAPILEELIFRGVILNGLLKNYNPMKAILISSVLFGLLHLNPWQFIAAFNLGLLAGWVFYRTKSIIPAIAVHFVNNGSASVLSYFEEGETEYNIPPLEVFGSPTITLITVAIASLLVWLCIVLLRRTLPAVSTLSESEEDSMSSDQDFNTFSDDR